MSFFSSVNFTFSRRAASSIPQLFSQHQGDCCSSIVVGSGWALGEMQVRQWCIVVSLFSVFWVQLVVTGYTYCYQPCMIAACGNAFFNDCNCGYNTKFAIMNCTASTCSDASQASRDSLSFLRQCSTFPQRRRLRVDNWRGVDRTSGIMAPTETVVSPPSTATTSGTGIAVFTSVANDPIGEYRNAFGAFLILGVASVWIGLV